MLTTIEINKLEIIQILSRQTAILSVKGGNMADPDNDNGEQNAPVREPRRPGEQER